MSECLRGEQLKTYLGKTVEIHIDRPIGYIHKKESYALEYPVNYGYIPGVLGGDGEELDVYLLGVDKPVEVYTARIIAVVYRHNDVEDKLVAAPENCSFTKSEIAKSVYFQEQYYESEIETIETVDIEQLNPVDYHKCSNIWDMSRQKDAEKWRQEIISGNRTVFVYKIDEEFIGEGALVKDTGDSEYTIPGKRIYVSRMIVKKEYRNRGIGSRILAFLISKAEEWGYSEMTVGVDKDNFNALRMYRKYGFTEIIFEGRDEYGEFLKLKKTLEIH